VGEAFRAVLIGGTSHVGKSTTARVLAARLGWRCISTDSLARHPGRPWRTPPDQVPAHVAAHFGTLTQDELMASVLAHYRANVRPIIERLVSEALAGEPLVLEGSALLPDIVGPLISPEIRAVWLTAPPELIDARIRCESAFETCGAASRRLIEAFAERSKRYDTEIIAEVRRLGLPVVAVTFGTATDAAVDAVLAALRHSL
jgi:2-phosphoglycerate kinase